MKTYRIIILFGLLTQIFLFYGCKKNNDPIGEISVIPEEIYIFDNDEKKVSLSLEPLGKTDWSVTECPEWVEIIPPFGTIDENIPKLTIKTNTGDLPQGSYKGVIKFEAEKAGSASLEVTMIVNEKEFLILNPQSVHFTSTEWEKTITMTNTGIEDYEYKCILVPNSLAIQNPIGIINPGKSKTLILNPIRDALTPGTHESFFNVSSADGSSAILVMVKIDVGDNPIPQ